MRISRALLLGTILLVSLSAYAQDRFEIFGEYSYLHFSPTITGVDSRSFNGGGGGATLYFLKIFGLKADFMGYGNTTFTRTYPTAVVIPGNGTIPAGTYTAQGDMFTYLAGPVLRIPTPLIKPFGEVLFGGSDTNGYVNLSKSIDQAGGTIATREPTPFYDGSGRRRRLVRFTQGRDPAWRIRLRVDQIHESADEHKQPKQLSLLRRRDLKILIRNALIQARCQREPSLRLPASLFAATRCGRGRSRARARLCAGLLRRGCASGSRRRRARRACCRDGRASRADSMMWLRRRG